MVPISKVMSKLSQGYFLKDTLCAICYVLLLVKKIIKSLAKYVIHSQLFLLQKLHKTKHAFAESYMRLQFVQTIFNEHLFVAACAHARACVCLRTFTVKASSVWTCWISREEIHDVVLKALFCCQVPSSLL